VTDNLVLVKDVAMYNQAYDQNIGDWRFELINPSSPYFQVAHWPAVIGDKVLIAG
jgi:hypothetical protein